MGKGKEELISNNHDSDRQSVSSAMGLSPEESQRPTTKNNNEVKKSHSSLIIPPPLTPSMIT